MSTHEVIDSNLDMWRSVITVVTKRERIDRYLPNFLQRHFLIICICEGLSQSRIYPNPIVSSWNCFDGSMFVILPLVIQQRGFSALWHTSNFPKCILLAHQVAAVLGNASHCAEVRAVILHPCNFIYQSRQCCCHCGLASHLHHIYTHIYILG